MTARRGAPEDLQLRGSFKLSLPTDPSLELELSSCGALRCQIGVIRTVLMTAGVEFFHVFAIFAGFRA
jgi:hypothetical protein